MTVRSHPYSSVGRKHATTRSFYAINFVGFIWMHLGMWLHPLFDMSIPLAPPLPCLSESSNLLPPLVIYLHCSAIIQVIKTPADRSIFTPWVWFISVCLWNKTTSPLLCVCCGRVCVCLYLTVCPQVCCRFRFKCSFFPSLYLPYATVWHFNRLFLSSSVSF